MPDIISAAMLFETQALDYYQRLARSFADQELASLMQELAKEELAHLKVLASFMDKLK